MVLGDYMNLFAFILEVKRLAIRIEPPCFREKPTIASLVILSLPMCSVPDRKEGSSRALTNGNNLVCMTPLDCTICSTDIIIRDFGIEPGQAYQFATILIFIKPQPVI